MGAKHPGDYLQVACRPLSQTRLTALYSDATMVEKPISLAGMNQSNRDFIVNAVSV